ncbi:hypothetical protein [Mesorhizobium sp. M0228]|uniref:hypothetical protein n=1 Tax=Mesorhizobium sp. M0228 TaxID=2956923 RepID=UPI00333B5455
MIKTPAEIAQKRLALEIAHDAFHHWLQSLILGMTERQFAKALTLNLIERGAESVPWLTVRFGRKDMTYSLPPTDPGWQRTISSALILVPVVRLNCPRQPDRQGGPRHQ